MAYEYCFKMYIQCLFRHFAVPPHLQEDVWRSVRTSLDRRSHRLKHLIRARQSTGFRTSTPISDLLEGLDQLENGADRQIVIWLSRNACINRFSEIVQSFIWIIFSNSIYSREIALNLLFTSCLRCSCLHCLVLSLQSDHKWVNF